MYGRLLPLDWETSGYDGVRAKYGDKKRYYPGNTIDENRLLWPIETDQGIPRVLQKTRDCLALAENILFLGFLMN